MDINATLLGQMITFLLFVGFTMKFVWPPIQQALEKRRIAIADGLAAAEAGHRELASAEQVAHKNIAASRQEAARILEETHKQVSMILEEAKIMAQEEGQRLGQKAEADIAQQYEQAKEQLRQEVARLALMGAERVVAKEIDAATHQALLNQLIKEV